jgi:hypothetical protein
MMRLNYNHAAELHGSFNTTIFIAANGVTHHGWGALFILGQTYLASVTETDDQSSANPSVTSFDTTTKGHVPLVGQNILGIAEENCTQVTYTLDVTNCDAFSACMTQAVI